MASPAAGQAVRQAAADLVSAAYCRGRRSWDQLQSRLPPHGNWLLAGVLIAAAAIASGTCSRLRRPGDAGLRVPAGESIPDAGSAARPQSVPEPAVVAVAAPAAVPVPAEAASSSAPASPAQASGPAVLPAAHEQVGPWSFAGRVYDIRNLKYVHPVKLTFMKPKGALGGVAETGAGGRYRIKLDALPEGGYILFIGHPDYKNRYIEAIPASIRVKSDQERIQFSKLAPMPEPLFGQPGVTAYKDFALIPKTD
jgi:hypothetical protein